MKLLVTGASGHVGGRVAGLAAARGFEVIAIYRSGAPGDGAGIEWHRLELGDGEAVAAFAAAHEIEACIHAAAVSNEAYAAPAPLAAVQANVMATTHLLDAARRHGWRRLIHVGTGSVFQLRADIEGPIPEDARPEPGNIYATTKAAAEMIVSMYRTVFGMSAATVRISWVYGPPIVATDPTRGPIPSYLARALRGEAIREGGGDFAASFTFIDDVAAGLLAAVAAADLTQEVYHLGPGRNFTASAVAHAVARAVPGARLEIGPGTEPWTRHTALRGPLVGIGLARDAGFEPGFDLARGIWAYSDWLRRHLDS